MAVILLKMRSPQLHSSQVMNYDGANKQDCEMSG